jgi:hypothetical protein
MRVEFRIGFARAAISPQVHHLDSWVIHQEPYKLHAAIA